MLQATGISVAAQDSSAITSCAEEDTQLFLLQDGPSLSVLGMSVNLIVFCYNLAAVSSCLLLEVRHRLPIAACPSCSRLTACPKKRNRKYLGKKRLSKCLGKEGESNLHKH